MSAPISSGPAAAPEGLADGAPAQRPPWRWLDTLFARVLVTELLLAVLITAVFSQLVARGQALSQARATAPLWALALGPALHDAPLPRSETISTQVDLLPGPPPPEAHARPLVARVQALVDELRSLGIPVLSAATSGEYENTVTWLELSRGEGRAWIGVRGAFEGTAARDRGTLVLGLTLVVLCGGAWWLSRRIVQPVRALHDSIRRFQVDGELPPEPPPSAPAELRALAAQFASFARERRAHEDNQRSMLAAISHDLRSPLGRIRLAAELLPDSPGVAPRRELIVRNTRLADRLLDSFIDLSRATDEPLTEAVDLAALVARLVDEEPDLSHAPAESPASPCIVQPASAIGLERALRNLVDNARQHGRLPIELGVQRSPDGRTGALSVRDHGPGVEPALRETLRQAFRRGQASRSHPGTGLGLAIVDRTASHHGGKLSLDDAGPGLRATLHLPLV
jgi:two-component system osmolarity sensor histidine kinase EnvZ